MVRIFVVSHAERFLNYVTVLSFVLQGNNQQDELNKASIWLVDVITLLTVAYPLLDQCYQRCGSYVSGHCGQLCYGCWKGIK